MAQKWIECADCPNCQFLTAEGGEPTYYACKIAGIQVNVADGEGCWQPNPAESEAIA